jgi:hypothetical protein
MSSFQGGLPTSAESDALIAVKLGALADLTSREREKLRALVEGGTTLYLRGRINEGIRYQLAPLVDLSFVAGHVPDVKSYRFADHEMIPAVLRGDVASFSGALNCVAETNGPAEVIIFAGDVNGVDHPVVFACRVGQGAIICDVQPDAEASDVPLIWRLADPVQRCAVASALVAVEHATRRAVARPVPFNLTIDDIPLAYDYLNEAILEDFLTYIEGRCERVHLDCAWIPTAQRISRKYVDILKHHGVGFLWHGMHRHVDHQLIDDPAADMEAGERAMAINAQRYGVQFQRMIIFPFERAHRSAEELVLREGFLGGAEQPRHDEGADMPGYLRYADVSCVHESGLRFLHRYESEFLTRDRMIAIAALGMPILAFGHPRDVRLRRLSGIIERGGTFAHFDQVLDFAAEKNLTGRSLEEIFQ